MPFSLRRPLLKSRRAEELLHQPRLDSVGHGSPYLRRSSDYVPGLVLHIHFAEFKRAEFHRSHSRRSLAPYKGTRAFGCTGNGDYVRCDGILSVFIRYFLCAKEDSLVLCNDAAITWSRFILSSRLRASGPAAKSLAEPYLNRRDRSSKNRITVVSAQTRGAPKALRLRRLGPQGRLFPLSISDMMSHLPSASLRSVSVNFPVSGSPLCRVKPPIM